MVYVGLAVVVMLGAFCVVLYLGQERQRVRHDEQVAKLVRQVTRSNPAQATLTAMTQTAEVLTTSVGKITETIGSSFATATGLQGGGSTIIEPPDETHPTEGDDEAGFPDHEFDSLFVDVNLPSGNGMISPPPEVQ